ncbi:hypothetical protein GCM10010937_14390 [Gluconobacter japonicus]|uniref:Uncharacterized protein n=1 Tax=Gluconobacter japonicus TaxID=376620 RepID=A0ABQ5WIN4_GLUJA|nr:hypothetical protein AA3271_2859 [Gluconobacter japonicus NBRC 3271]GLQ59636.1 hypothetical protein GCM10010937_14390 [Gluconobacter japonicus]
MADLKKITLYQTGSRRASSNSYVVFAQAESESYCFEMGIRSVTTTEAQWEQICQAYRGAMTAYTPSDVKPLTFEIDEIK